MNPTAAPTEIVLHRRTRELEVVFGDDLRFRLSAEYLRTHSPSAEVQGHGPGQKSLLSGKQGVAITAVEPVGQYGVLLRFDDGHDTGIFSWEILYSLGRDYEKNWPTYLHELEHYGLSRKA